MTTVSHAPSQRNRSPSPVLDVVDVHREFRGRPPVTALAGVRFAADAGEVVGLLGANGAGKTTLVKIICTLLLPTSGTVRVCGHDIHRSPAAVRRQVGVVFGGDRGLYTRLTARDNLLFFGGLAGLRSGLARRVDEVLAQVGLAERGRSRVETLSRGMRQRLHLAAGLLTSPPLLLLDEPTVGLDVPEAQRVRDTIGELAGAGTTILLTSHYPIDIDQLAGRVVVLHDAVVRHDLPIDKFRRLAGFVAELQVRCAGSPVVPDGLATTLTPLDDGDTMVTMRLREWSPQVLAEVTAVLGAAAVRDVAVRPVGVETVLSSILGDGTP